jgi:dolichol-phosphate mannosyltransferase
MRGQVDLSIVIPTLNERENLRLVIPALTETVRALALRGEILVIDGGSSDGTGDEAERQGARVIVVPSGGYGEAMRVGLRAAAGEYVVTMDADLSHEPEVIETLWAARAPLTIGIASRYVEGGTAVMSRFRWLLSRLLNIAFAHGLALPVKDLSSGFRIYPAADARALRPTAGDFDILIELLVRAYKSGWRIVEVPFHYAPRRSGSSKARVIRLGRAYIGTFARLWKLRNTMPAAPSAEAPAALTQP